ncbi:SusC/RagA family TonB-linked outer membrane protein [Parachryseolinea silvisoli]|uniref:SusC/RagA family TonB-linked outer membrane protein n=1 Tax=Parachryseolinea silvisoli TaxID=2873601 RepID=UPI002265F1E0|nr:SusC/RagA family TonB-linked outer membrane protein [Parachryseolinea silvisoli]
MKRMLLAFVTASLMLVHEAWAQDRTIAGRITSPEDGTGLPGVNVLVKGTTNGTVTDTDGNYTLSVPSGSNVLVFTFIGLTTQEVEIGDRSTVDVQMASDIRQLSEVVVTALNIPRDKRSIGYAVQQVDGSAVSDVKTNNFVNSLSGKIAGVAVNGSPGSLGGSTQIMIRGIKSITGDNRPLYVVDGTPIDNSNYNGVPPGSASGVRSVEAGFGGTDYGDAVADINPNDIASITVLKGANAAALYGSRAANGVILITTKSGRGIKKGIGIDISSSLEFAKVAVLPKYQNEYGGGYTQTFSTYQGEPVVNYAADESWGPRMDGTPVRQWYSWFPDDPDYGKLTPFSPHKDNIKDFYETGVTRNNSIALVGGNDKTNFRVGYTNYNATGTFPNNELTKNNISLNVESKLTDKLQVIAHANYAHFLHEGIPTSGYSDDLGNTNNSTSFNQWFQRQLDMDKLRHYKTALGEQRSWNISSPTNLHPLYWNNPFWEVYESPTNQVRERVFGDVSLKYQILKGLAIQGWARTDFYTDRRERRQATGSLQQSYYDEDVREVRDNNFELHLTYNKELSPDFTLNLLAGTNVRKRKFYQNYGRTSGGLNSPNFFNLNASIDRPLLSDIYQQKEVQSIFGSASIGYKSLAYLDITGRNDWSSVLPSKNRSYFYPSATGTFVFSELISDHSTVSLGKVRASWARVGNDTDPYRVNTTYQIQTAFGSNPAYGVANNLNNKDLDAEETTTIEFGLEMSFLNGRAGFDLTYYDTKTEKQIIGLDVSAASKYNKYYVNAGEMSNKGFEVMLYGTPIKSASGFNWDISVNWARNVNEVVRLYQGLQNLIINDYSVTTNARIGEPYGTFVMIAHRRDENGTPIVTASGAYVQQPNTVLGTFMPDWTGGVVNTFSYKGFTLGGTIDIRHGGNIYSTTNRYGTYSGLLEETAGLNDKGNPMRDPVADGGGVHVTGVLANGEAYDGYVAAQSYFKNYAGIRENFLYDASFVKLRELRLAYALPAAMLAKTPFTGISIGVYGRNLAILHKNTPNIDPETALGSGNIQGLENGQHPSTRVIGVNVNLKL